MNLAVGEAQRRDHVVGDALGAQVVQDRIVHLTIGIGEPAAKGFAGRGNMRHRTVAKNVALQEIETAVRDHRPGIRPPDETAADDLRMQGAHEHDDPPKRQAASRQALAELAQDFLRQRRRPRAVHQPVDYRLRAGGVHRAFTSWILQAVFLFHRREEAVVLQAVEQAAVDIIADLLAGVGEQFEDVLRALYRRLEVLRRLLLEIVVGDVENFGAGDLEFLRQHLLGALLVGERDVIAFDARFKKARQQIAARGDVVLAHDDAAEQPRNLVGYQIDQHVDALFARRRRDRLVDRRGLDLARLHRLEPLRAAAIFLDDHVVAGQPELLQGQRHRRIAFRSEGRDADDTAFEIGRALDAGRREEREADDVRQRADDAQIAAGLIDLDDRRKADMHDVDARRLQFLGAAAAAVHVEDFDVEPLRAVEPGGARHVPGENRVYRIGNAGFDLQGWRRRSHCRRLLRRRRLEHADGNEDRQRGDKDVFLLHCRLPLELPEQPAETLDAILDTAAAQRVPDDRLVRGHAIDAELALQNVKRARRRPMRRWEKY